MLLKEKGTIFKADLFLPWQSSVDFTSLILCRCISMFILGFLPGIFFFHFEKIMLCVYT